MRGFSLSVAACALALTLPFAGAACAAGAIRWAPIPHGPTSNGLGFLKPLPRRGDARAEIALGLPVAEVAPPPPPSHGEGATEAQDEGGGSWRDANSEESSSVSHGPRIIYIGNDDTASPRNVGPRIVYGDQSASLAIGPKVIYGDPPQ